MERDEYRRMAVLEATMWWYRALHAQLGARLGDLHFPPGAQLLDAGCGTGGFLKYIKDRKLPFLPHGIEFDPEAAGLAAAKAGVGVEVGSVNALPYRAGAWQAIVSADVLCHAGVDEGRALAEFHRCLAPGGALVLSLPAYTWMLSAHDHHVHNVRRYTAGRVRQLLAGAGFTDLRVGYWNSLLFPLMLLHRLTAGRRQDASDVQAFSPVVDRLLFAVTAVERGLHRAGISLPFGGSVWAVAYRRREEQV